VPAATEKAYQNSPLVQYSLGQRLIIRIVGALSFLAVKILGSSLRFEVEGLEHLEQIESAGRQPIYCVWHDRIVAGTYFLRGRGIVVMTSQSRDGEYIAGFLQRFGFGVARGSSSRGGSGALVEMIRVMRAGRPTAFTVDGPRGPRYEAKPGPVLLAKKTGDPMMPFVVECEKFWKMKSWDRLQVPKPFSRVKFIIAAPIFVDANSSDEDLELRLADLQWSLNELVERGCEWREGG
jgi:lysophospholipid acyltransferase (LPLAT)-like uncharacterized protein